jgi:hypothetical protein
VLIHTLSPVYRVAPKYRPSALFFSYLVLLRHPTCSDGVAAPWPQKPSKIKAVAVLRFHGEGWQSTRARRYRRVKGHRIVPTTPARPRTLL